MKVEPLDPHPEPMEEDEEISPLIPHVVYNNTDEDDVPIETSMNEIGMCFIQSLTIV